MTENIRGREEQRTVMGQKGVKNKDWEGSKCCKHKCMTQVRKEVEESQDTGGDRVAGSIVPGKPIKSRDGTGVVLVSL